MAAEAVVGFRWLREADQNDDRSSLRDPRANGTDALVHPLEIVRLCLRSLNPVFAARLELVERSAHGADTERMRIIGFDRHVWGTCCIPSKDNRFIHDQATSIVTLAVGLP